MEFVRIILPLRAHQLRFSYTYHSIPYSFLSSRFFSFLFFFYLSLFPFGAVSVFDIFLPRSSLEFAKNIDKAPALRKTFRFFSYILFFIEFTDEVKDFIHPYWSESCFILMTTFSSLLPFREKILGVTRENSLFPITEKLIYLYIRGRAGY